MNFDMNFDMKNQPRCRSWFSLSLFITPPHRFPPDTRHGANFIRVSEHSEGRKKRKVSTK